MAQRSGQLGLTSSMSDASTPHGAAPHSSKPAITRRVSATSSSKLGRALSGWLSCSTRELASPVREARVDTGSDCCPHLGGMPPAVTEVCRPLESTAQRRRPANGLDLFACQAKAKRYEHASREAVEETAHPGAAKNVSGLRNGKRVTAEPGECEGAEN